MVNVHGPDCTRILRERFKYDGLIVGITGNAMVADMEIFTASGTDAVLTKPLSMTGLLSLLRDRGLIP